jgi:hypothetical protein
VNRCGGENCNDLRQRLPPRESGQYCGRYNYGRYSAG